MNNELTNRKIHFNLPSLFGLIAQIVLVWLWFTKPFICDLGFYDKSITTESMYYLLRIPEVYQINIALLIVALIPWIIAVLCTALRALLYIPIIVSYIQVILTAGIVFLYKYDSESIITFSLNEYGIAIVAVSAICVILSHISYSVIKKYRKSLKEAKAGEAQENNGN